jgi:NitT/TauT family transport system permease protein
MREIMNVALFTPNARFKQTPYLILGWAGVFTVLWTMFKPVVFPTPIEVVQAFPGLISEGMLDELFRSFSINLQAILLSAAIGLPLCYVCRVPVITPVVNFLAKLRFVGPSVFFVPLVFLADSSHTVKILLLTLGQLFYLVTTVSGVVRNIPEAKFDDARTLNMSEWLSVWYVVIRGTVAEAIDAIRDNAAIGWAMLMFVEGIIRSEGGIGVMMLNTDKHVNWAETYALAVTILLVGVAQDWIIGQIRKASCPYAG